MTNIDDATVVELTEDETREAVRSTLEAAGVADYASLEQQAESGHFQSRRARMAWFALKGLGKYA